MATAGSGTEAERLEELRRRAAERAKATAERQRLEELRQLELEDKQATEIEAIRAKHGDKVEIVTCPAGVVAVRRPLRVRYRRFVDEGKTDTAALQALVEEHLAHPDLDGFEAISAECPAIIEAAADAVCWLAGASRTERLGK